MNWFSRPIASLCLLVLLSSSAHGLTVDELIGAVQKTYRDRSDITVQFKQVITKSATGRKIKSRGSILYQHPDRFLWYQRRPDVVKYISDGKVLWHVQPTQNSAEKLLLKKTRLFATLRLFFGKGDLKRDHTVSVGQLNGADTLVLVPRVKSLYKTLTLVIDRKSRRIIQTRMIDPNDNLFSATYTKVSFTPIDRKQFVFSPDPSMNVRDLTKPPKSSR